MGDFFDGEEVDADDLDSSFVVYLHKGKFKYGTFNRYELDLSLSDDSKQIVEYVEGTKTRPTKFTHIEKLGELDIQQEELFSNEKGLEMFRAIYKTFRNSPDGKIINISEEELNDPNGKLTFDLVGTD